MGAVVYGQNHGWRRRFAAHGRVLRTSWITQMMASTEKIAAPQITPLTAIDTAPATLPSPYPIQLRSAFSAPVSGSVTIQSITFLGLPGL